MTKSSEEKDEIVISYGGWYQRTTLHLTEIYDFCHNGTSHLALDKKQLQKFWRSLAIQTVTRQPGALEFVHIITTKRIVIRYYEDGLYVFELSSTMKTLKKDQNMVEEYAHDIFAPAMNYIFSLGAPTPKILANIPVKHPVVLRYLTDDLAVIPFSSRQIGDLYSTISVGNIVVHKTLSYILIGAKPGTSHIQELVETYIFFREFKSQLEKYLSIHRTLWEKISDIKERKSLRVKELDHARGILDGYQKTVTLIGSRMQQMGSYSATRRSLARSLDIDETLRDLFSLKFETLQDTLEYVKELWKMTIVYLQTAISNISDIKGQGTQRGIQMLQVLTTVGALNILIGLFTKKDLLIPTTYGIWYVLGVLLLSWCVMTGIGFILKQKKYSLTFNDKNEDL